MTEKPLRIRGCISKESLEKFTTIDVRKSEDLEAIARNIGTVIVECIDEGYEAVVDAKNRLLFRKKIR